MTNGVVYIGSYDGNIYAFSQVATAAQDAAAKLSLGSLRPNFQPEGILACRHTDRSGRLTARRAGAILGACS